jgi:hypothetical protein
MRKLEPKDIVGYLPYDLKCKYKDEKTIWTLDLSAIEADYKNLKLPLWHYDCVDEIFLRPLSDLTKPIKVDGYNEGKEFIPLVELAKNSDDIVSEYSLEIIKSVPNCIEIGDGYILQYLGHSFMCFDEEDAQYSPINNVHLFDLLNQWHFDYRNLINDGLAVDINTITI